MREIKLVLCVILLWLFYFSIKYQDFIFINVKEMFVYFTPKPMVSVVIASYHMGKVLPEAINSIIEQSYKDWEVVVIDDGSLDNTQKILRQYRFNRKIRVLKNSDNVGITESLNKGLKRARGKYIARLDADDYSYPDRLERQVELMEKENLDLLAHTFNIKNSEVTFLEENRNNYEVGLNLLMCNRLCHSSVMMRKSFLQKHNLLYTKNYANAEDYELWVKIFLAGGKIALIGGHPIVIYHPSLHSEKWFATQDKSRDEIRMWAISRIVPKFERKMLRLSFCELLPIIIDGNKSTKVLNQEELEKQYVLKCQNVKKQRKGL